MRRWIDGARMTLRPIMAGVAVLFMVFGFTHLRSLPVQAGISASQGSEPSWSHGHSQNQVFGFFAQEVEALITMPIEADLLDDESRNEREIAECVPCKAPIHDPLRLYSARDKLLTAFQNFASRNAVLLI